MGKDLRTFTKLDVAYFQNPKWFKIERWLRDNMPTAMPTAMQPALLTALREAREAHLQSVCYCAQSRTDGVFPVAAIKGLARIQYEEAITALFEVGLWVNLPGGMAELHDFLEHNPSSAELEEVSRIAKEKADRRWRRNAVGNAVGNADSNAVGNAEERRGEESRKKGANSPTPRKRATRIPDDFAVTPSMLSWASKNAPHTNVDRATAKFVDYWTAASGAKASKLDWVATWRNWMREEEERSPRSPKQPSLIDDDPFAYLGKGTR